MVKEVKSLEKKHFKISVREIGNGFIVAVENRHGVEWGERFCEHSAAIMDQILIWVHKIFEEKEAINGK